MQYLFVAAVVSRVRGDMILWLGTAVPLDGALRTKRSKNELIKSHPLHCRAERARLGDGEAPLEELEPLELYRGHAEAVRHEPRQPFEVEGRRQNSRVGN